MERANGKVYGRFVFLRGALRWRVVAIFLSLAEVGDASSYNDVPHGCCWRVSVASCEGGRSIQVALGSVGADLDGRRR